MDEFALIDCIRVALGEQAAGPDVLIGPGDDAAVVQPPSDGMAAVASIDTLLPDVHFPADAPADAIGYRALMVAASDLAAMAAHPGYAVISLSLPQSDAAWVSAFAHGLAEASREISLPIVGGNLSRGPLNIAVSVHGWVGPGGALLRSGARAGDLLQVSGPLGSAAACVRSQQFSIHGALTAVQQAYFRPRARLDLTNVIASAHAAIDVSDGLLQDANHMAQASACALHIDTSLLPVGADATLQDGLTGGDDYQILATAPAKLPGFTVIGDVRVGAGVVLDGQAITGTGYDHFRA